MASGSHNSTVVEAELAKIKATQTSLIKREQLAQELATVEEPIEDFQEKIEKLKAQFNPANIEIGIRKLIFLARNNADEAAKRRLMPIVRDLIQTVVIGKTPCTSRQACRCMATSPTSWHPWT
jgi:site-specific DNA recombinase